jgi:hypothetical protein
VFIALVCLGVLAAGVLGFTVATLIEWLMMRFR